MTKPNENEQSEKTLTDPETLGGHVKDLTSRVGRLENPYYWRRSDRSKPERPSTELQLKGAGLDEKLKSLDETIRDIRSRVDSLAEPCGLISESLAGREELAPGLPGKFSKSLEEISRLTESLKKGIGGLPSSVKELKKKIIDEEIKVQQADHSAEAKSLWQKALSVKTQMANNQILALNASAQSIERESDTFLKGVTEFNKAGGVKLLEKGAKDPEGSFAEFAAAIYRFKQQLELFDSQLPREHFEHQVQEFYDFASIAYERLMGNRWHTGDPDAEDAGFSIEAACEVLEERVISLTGVIGEDAGSQANTGAQASEGGVVKKVFDFGSGIGGPTLHMARFANAKLATHQALKGKVSKAYFVGVTNNGRLNARAHQRATALGLSEFAEFVTLDDVGYKNLPRDKFPDESFDAATFFESVCHLTDKAALFHELFRILRPGARLAGIDWIQRRFRDIQTEPQIMEHMKWVNKFVRIPWHGTVEGYKDMMVNAGFEVLVAKDLFEGIECWGSTPPQDAQGWGGTQGPGAELFVEGKKALDAARAAGVFSIGLWVARKPLSPR